MKKGTDISEFDIYFAGLKTGKHQFIYQIDSKFVFDKENSLIKEFEADVNIEIEKQSEILGSMELELKGKTRIECERCLSVFEYPFSVKDKIVLKVDWGKENEDDGIIFIQPPQNIFNVADKIYEYLQEIVPFRKNCNIIQQDCNEDMINLISKYIVENKSETEGDSRWESLKNLIKN